MEQFYRLPGQNEFAADLVGFQRTHFSGTRILYEARSRECTSVSCAEGTADIKPRLEPACPDALTGAENII
jgi:hypothetical protein